MIDSTKDLYFSDYGGCKAVGTTGNSAGNALKNQSAKEIIIPEFYQGFKVIAIHAGAFENTCIESCFISKYIKTIFETVFWNCYSLKYITFDANSELEELSYEFVAESQLMSINLPHSLKTIDQTYSLINSNNQITCVSYFGSIDLSYESFIISPANSLVTHAMPKYLYKFSIYQPELDGQKCPEKTFSIQLKKKRRGCTCYYHRKNQTSFIQLIILIIKSSF